MTNQDKVQALRRRVNAERRTAGDKRVRFSDGLKADVLEALERLGWGQERLGNAVGISPSVLGYWASKRPTRGGVGRLRKVRVAAEPPASSRSIDLVFPGGARVSGLTMADLAQLVEARS